MYKRLRVMLIATALLLLPQLGQLLAVRDINTAGREGTIAFLLMMIGVFIIPTSLILTAAIIYTIRRQLRRNERLLLLGVLNVLISLNLVWFFAHTCSWAQIFGIALRTCTG